MKRNIEKRIAGGDLSLSAVRAVLVSVDGDTEVSVYRDIKPTDHYDVWSVTKSVLSILVGIAIDEGRLRLDQKLPELLPDYAERMSPQVKAITLDQLLTMTAGESTDVSYDLGVKDAVGRIIDNPLIDDPGSSFGYSNLDAHLVAAVLKQAVDRPLLDYARKKLFDPLGIDSRPAWQGQDPAKSGTGFGWAADREGINTGCCGLKLTAPDMIKIGELYLHEGRWKGRQLVSADWVRASTVDQLTPEQSPFDAPQGYGYLWWTSELSGHPFFAAQGSYGQIIGVMPDLHLVMVILCDETGLEDPTPEFYNLLNEDILGPLLQAPR